MITGRGCRRIKIRELKQRRRRRQRERQKGNRFGLAKQHLCTCITLFRIFLCRHYTTTTWKCLISHFEEYVNRGQRSPFSFQSPGRGLIGSLSNYDDDHNDDFKKTIGLIDILSGSKFIFLPTFSLPSSSSLLKVPTYTGSGPKHQAIFTLTLRIYILGCHFLWNQLVKISCEIEIIRCLCNQTMRVKRLNGEGDVRCVTTISLPHSPSPPPRGFHADTRDLF